MTQLERRRTLYDRFEPWVLSEALTRHDLAVAVALADMCGEDGQDLILAIAFAVAAPQSGHTAVDLRQIRKTAHRPQPHAAGKHHPPMSINAY